MISVSAGIVCREDGRILICRRGEGRSNAHLWEFPGGKQESGETPAACLIRELQEELQLPVSDAKELCTREEGGILFTFLTAKTAAEPVLTEHEACAFVTPREMLRYPFCPADTAVARELALSHPPLRCFLWDLDGTLMDTYPGMTAAFCKAAARFGIETDPRRVLTLMKIRLGHCCRVIGSEHGVHENTLLRAFREEEACIDPDLIQPLPGIPEALRALKRLGGRHYAVTHRSRESSWRYLEHAGLKALFDGGVFPEDGLPAKPAPDMILRLMAKHGLDPTECVMIGDRPLDIESGRAAGVIGCLLDTEGRFPDTPCDLRAASAQGLEKLLVPGRY